MLDQLRTFLTSSPAPSTDDVVAEVRRLQVATASPPTARAALFAKAVLDGHAEGAATPAHLAAATVAAVKSSRNLAILRSLLTGKDAAAPGPSQQALIEAIAGIIARHPDGLTRATPVLLQALYDSDLLEEEAIVAWFNGKAGGAAAQGVRTAAAPFVDWLQSAEEEDDEEDEDDE